MSLYMRTAREVSEQAEADREREYPQCPTCSEPIGWPGGCAGHCLECQDAAPLAGEDFCAACTKKINAIGMCPVCGDPCHNGKCEGFGET